MTYQTTTTIGWGSRITSSIKNLMGGLVLLLIGIILLFWNEGRAVKRSKLLSMGESQVTSVDLQKSTILPEEQIIHFSGAVTPLDSLKDEQTGLTYSAIHLQREVLIYQWKETEKKSTKKKTGGSKEETVTYDYEKGWFPGLNNSQKFQYPNEHSNPATPVISNQKWTSNSLVNNEIELTEKVLSRLNDYEYLEVRNEPKIGEISQYNDGKQSRSGIFLGKGSAASPQVGDAFIFYKVVPASVYSFVGQVFKNQFSAFKDDKNQSLLLVQKGAVPVDQMFTQAKSNNATTLWIFRALGFALLFFGWYTLCAPIVVIADVVPIFGDILGFGLGIFSFIMSLSVGLLVIGLGWFFYRPILSIVLILAAIGVVWAVKKYKVEPTPG